MRIHDGFDSFDASEREVAALAVWLEAQRREQILAASNAATNLKNMPVFVALEETTGQFHKRELTTWCDWWRDYNELHDAGSSGKPTRYLYQVKNASYDVYARERYHYQDWDVKGYSCFLAGTTVWTEQGRVPIEQIKIGDRVLSQDPDTGELSYELVLNTTLRPPSPMIKVTVDGEDIFTTLGHPMWVSKKRWRMAKLLEVGEQLHGISGILTVDGVDQGVPMNEAHNLVVAGHATYFVGEKGVLVHDNTYRAPTQALVPGLLPRRPGGM